MPTTVHTPYHQQLPKITIVEMSSQGDILANVIAIEYAVKQARQCGSDLVVLPENTFCFGNQARAAQFFEPLQAWCGKLAQHYHVYLLAGTLPCPFRPDGTKVDDGKFRQSSLLFDPSGQQVARYDKIHLFKATVNDSTGSYDEGKTFEAGDTPVVANTDLGNIGMMVCFDIRFPNLALTLRAMGADLLTAPSAFTYATGQAHWQSLLTARALDSQCLVVGAGQTGRHYFSKNGKIHERQTWGHSQFINANGECVGNAVSLDITDMTALECAKQAQSWLNTDKANLTLLPANIRLVTTSFDKTAQNAWRQQLPIADCARSLPTQQ